MRLKDRKARTVMKPTVHDETVHLTSMKLGFGVPQRLAIGSQLSQAYTSFGFRIVPQEKVEAVRAVTVAEKLRPALREA
jgi:hypothetical protein